MLFCLLHDSPLLGKEERGAIDANQNRVAVRGRDPSLTLFRGGSEVPLRTWAGELLDELTAVAELVRTPDDDPAAVVGAARASVGRPEATPSARVLEEMRTGGSSHFEYTLDASRRHAETLRGDPLPDPERLRFEAEAATSIDRQAALEASDSVTFEEYLAGFFA